MRRSRSARDRGFSLVELAVYAALLLALMGGLYLLVNGGMRYFRLGEAYQVAQAEALVGTRKMTRELTNTSQNRVQHGDAPTDYVLFLSADEPLPAPSGNWTYSGTQLEYKKWVSFYHDQATRELVRAELPLGAPTVDPGSEAFPDFAAEILPLTRQVISRGVATLDFDDGPSGTIEVLLEAERQTYSDRGTRVQLRCLIRMMNL